MLRQNIFKPEEFQKFRQKKCSYVQFRWLQLSLLRKKGFCCLAIEKQTRGKLAGKKILAFLFWKNIGRARITILRPLKARKEILLSFTTETLFFTASFDIALERNKSFLVKKNWWIMLANCFGLCKL